MRTHTRLCLIIMPNLQHTFAWKIQKMKVVEKNSNYIMKNLWFIQKNKNMCVQILIYNSFGKSLTVRKHTFINSESSCVTHTLANISLKKTRGANGN